VKTTLTRLLSLLLCLALIGSMLPAAVFADSEIWMENPTGWTSADQVVYQTASADGKTYVLNWGVRGERAVFLTTYALDYYGGAAEAQSWAAEMTAQYAGGTNQDDVTSSQLYAALRGFVQGKQSYQTSYDGTRSLFKYTDCMVSESGHISSFYSGIKLNGAWDSGHTWNREHTWPNSKGFDKQDDDIMMLRPTSVSENSSRGNTAYGESAGYYHPNIEAGNRFDLRGDVARIMLYCYVRWSNQDYMWGQEGVIESMEVMLRWMEEDPVDTWEMGRNDSVQSITGVRNCFVDYPELAWALFSREAPANAYLNPEAPSPVCVGIDVSEHNGAINWATVSNQVDFAILRVGYTGSTVGNVYKDAKFDANLQGCVANHIPFGLYYYAGATTKTKAIQEADAVLAWLEEAGVSPDLPIFYDVEENANILTLSNPELAEVNAAFCDKLESAGYRAGVYASASLWDYQFNGYEVYDGMAHWVAHWGTHNLTAAPGANVWQYASDGTVPGISGAVDMNYWIGPLGDTEHPSTAVLVDPGCLDGKLTSTCVRCGLVQEQPIPGKGHTPGNPVTENEQAPSCTEAGSYDQVVYCAVCGAELSRVTNSTAALGHDYRSTVTEPSCTEAGGTRWTCARCGDSYLENETAPLGHDWDEGVVTLEPTDDEDGQRLFTCQRCGATRTEIIPRLNQINPFVDVSEGKYYYEPVMWAFYHEPRITSGTDETHFSPNAPCTREQIVFFLWATAGKPAPAGSSAGFTDVKANRYYYEAVCWAKEQGITTGVSETSFGVGSYCTRSQAVTFLWRAADAPAPGDTQNPFTDVSARAYYADAVLWAVENGVTSGTSANAFSPKKLCTRGEIVTFLYAARELIFR
jgi:GH25 family lysozyme M1 (1,4-beta-N-acetylmuramidase)/endonuclease I